MIGPLESCRSRTALSCIKERRYRKYNGLRARSLIRAQKRTAECALFAGMFQARELFTQKPPEFPMNTPGRFRSDLSQDPSLGRTIGSLKTRENRGRKRLEHGALARRAQKLPAEVREEMARLLEIAEGQKQKLKDRASASRTEKNSMRKLKLEAVREASQNKVASDAHLAKNLQLKQRNLEMKDQFYSTQGENTRQRNLNDLLVAEIATLRKARKIPGLLDEPNETSGSVDSVDDGSLMGSSAAGSVRSLASSVAPSFHTVKTNTINALSKHNQQLASRVSSLEDQNKVLSDKLKAAERKLRTLTHEGTVARTSGDEGQRRAGGGGPGGGVGTEKAVGQVGGSSEVHVHRRERSLRAGALMELPASTESVQEADRALVDLITSGAVEAGDGIMRLRQLQAIQVSTLLHGASTDPQLRAARALVSKDVCELFDVEVATFFGVDYTATASKQRSIWSVSSANNHTRAFVPDNDIIHLAEKGRVISVHNKEALSSFDPALWWGAQDSSPPVIRSAMVVPLIGGDHGGRSRADTNLVGLIFLANKKPRQVLFNQLDEVLATLLAGYVVRALSNIDQIATIESRNESLVRIMTSQRDYNLLAASAVSPKASTTGFSMFDPIAMLAALTEHARTTLRAQAARIFIKLDSRAAMRTTSLSDAPFGEATWTVRREVLPNTTRFAREVVALNDGSIAGRVLATELPQYLDSSNADPHFNPTVDLALGVDSPMPLVCVPLLVPSRGCCGVLQLVPSSTSKAGAESRCCYGWGAAKPLSLVDAATMFALVMQGEINGLCDCDERGQ
jgi:hypothetical protein